jgi:hypothetical protein
MRAFEDEDAEAREGNKTLPQILKVKLTLNELLCVEWDWS